MSAIPSKPLDFHKAITRIEEHYKTTLSLPKDPLALRAIQSIFTQMNPSTLGALSEKENETLRRLYQDISKIPCSQHPSWVQELQKYPNLQAQRLPSSKVQIRHPLESNSAFLKALGSDPVIGNWRKAPEDSAEHTAYLRIKDYAAPITKPKLPPLDLSNLRLTELPACLFTDPIFSGANIAGNKCDKFPQELTIGSVCNIRLYEQMIEQINTPVKRVLRNPDLVGHIHSFLNTKESNAIAGTSTSFKKGDVLSSRERLENIKKNPSIYNRLSPELQQELNNVNIRRSEEGYLSPKDCHTLDVKIAIFLDQQKILSLLKKYQTLSHIPMDTNLDTLSFEDLKKLKKETSFRLENDSLILAFPKILNQIPSELKQEGLTLIDTLSKTPTLSSQDKASAITAFLAKHETSLSQIESLDLSDLYLDAIPSALSFFKELNQLNLGYNQIADISPLDKLTALNALYLHYNQIVDISPLEKLTALTFLFLHNNQITDISPLEKLTALTNLHLDNNQIANLDEATAALRQQLPNTNIYI